MDFALYPYLLEGDTVPHCGTALIFDIIKYMCLATPSKIMKIEGNWAVVNSGKHSHRANLSLVKNAKVGDYVIIHGDLILNKIQKKEAEKILNLIKNNKNICKTKV